MPTGLPSHEKKEYDYNVYLYVIVTISYILS